jgi:hypothetical protein
MDVEEANVILTHISFVKTVRIGFIIGIEDRLTRSSEDAFLQDQLLLVFSSLATKGSDEVEDRVMSVLSSRVAFLTNMTQPDFHDVAFLLHALGNTGSKMSIPLIFSFLDLDSDDNDKIELSVIDALGKVTDDPIVLNHLENFLRECYTADCVAAVMETLEQGSTYYAKIDMDLYSNRIRSHTLLHTLAEAVSFVESSDLLSRMAEYLKKMKVDDRISIREKRSAHLNELSGSGLDADPTTSSPSPSPSPSPSSSPSPSPSPWSIRLEHGYSKTIGTSRASIYIAYNTFVTSTSCEQTSAFGQLIVTGTLISSTTTIADVKFAVDTTPESAFVQAFVRIGSNTLLDRRGALSSSSQCARYTRSIARFSREIFRISHSYFVYVARLTLSVGLSVHFDIGIEANACIGRSVTEVTGVSGSFTPTVGVTISGGVTGNLLVSSIIGAISNVTRVSVFLIV